MSSVVRLDIYRVLSASDSNPLRYFIPIKRGKRIWHGVGLDLKTKHHFYELNARERAFFGRESNFEHVTTLEIVVPELSALDRMYLEATE